MWGNFKRLTAELLWEPNDTEWPRPGFSPLKKPPLIMNWREQSHCGCGVSQLNSHRMNTRTNFTKKADVNSFTPLRWSSIFSSCFFNRCFSLTFHFLQQDIHLFILFHYVASWLFATLLPVWPKTEPSVLQQLFISSFQDCTAYSEIWAALSDTFTVTNTGFVFLSFHTCLPTPLPAWPGKGTS